MALDPSRLGTAIKAAMMSAGASDNAATTAFANGLAAAIVTEVVTNAEVQPTALLAPPGVAGGPVTGTGKVA